MRATRLRLGIDVGGTNTDAAVLRGRDVIATAKRFTTDDVKSGVVDAVSAVLAQLAPGTEPIAGVMIGTTQFVNAFVQRRGLTPVAIFRIGLPMTDGIPPLAGWPEDVAALVGGQISLVRGGSYFTAKSYAPLDEAAIREAAVRARRAGLRTISITATFAPLRPDIEDRAAAIVRDVIPDARITLSSRVGGIGLLDRENAAIVNATLTEMSAAVVAALERALRELGIDAPMYLSQNDGTLITPDVAADFPVFTCSAGPTNSIRGAAFLTGIEEGIVADIGGTTTDVGFLAYGFPRETASPHSLGGVRSNLRMPDLLSIGVGGGSLVRRTGTGWTVGPQSVGRRLQEKARIFGGTSLTATDIAVRAAQAAIGDPSRVSDIDADTVNAALDDIHGQIESAIDQIKVSARPLPLILVGGGSILISRAIRGTCTVVTPPHADVANAIGAAIALVSGRVDTLFDFERLGREAALVQAKRDATAAAVTAGAEEHHVRIVEVVELPMTHVKAGSVEVKVRAVGPLAAFAE